MGLIIGEQCYVVHKKTYKHCGKLGKMTIGGGRRAREQTVVLVYGWVKKKWRNSGVWKGKGGCIEQSMDQWL